jgi:hypothetical protein
MNEDSLPAYKELNTYVAGVMHEERYIVIPQLSLRQLVQLRREPHNPADANAILVETENGQKVGYIRRELASYLAPQIDRELRPIHATVTELASDAAGSAYRVRINFSVPSEWLTWQDSFEHTSEEPIEYTYDDSGPNIYVLLNSSEKQFNKIRERMTAEGISYTRYGLCYRSAHNGRPYQWYIRIDGTPEMKRILIEEFFRSNFKVEPEFELIQVLEEAKKRFESEILALRTTLSKEAKDYEKLAEEIDAESQHAKHESQRKIEQLHLEVKALEDEIRQVEDEKRGLTHENRQLKTFSTFNSQSNDGDNIPDGFADLLKEVISETLTPRQSLLVIRRLFPRHIEVLNSALKSSDASESFRRKKLLFALLWELATGYRYALASGRSDAEARSGFGAHYAAQESDQVMNNPRARNRRTFSYNGEQVSMMKHLKIGANKGVSDTIRVHFEWDPSQSIIVIGHCGPHLDQK